jgi:hypothetical protein
MEQLPFGWGSAQSGMKVDLEHALLQAIPNSAGRKQVHYLLPGFEQD